MNYMYKNFLQFCLWYEITAEIVKSLHNECPRLYNVNILVKLRLIFDQGAAFFRRHNKFLGLFSIQLIFNEIR